VRQFDVLSNPNRREQPWAPYMVVLQSHFLETIETTIVAPLIEDMDRRLNAVEVGVDFEGRPFVLAVSELKSTALATSARRVGSLAEHEDDIRRGLEKLFTGF